MCLLVDVYCVFLWKCTVYCERGNVCIFAFVCWSGVCKCVIVAMREWMFDCMCFCLCDYAFVSWFGVCKCVIVYAWVNVWVYVFLFVYAWFCVCDFVCIKLTVDTDVDRLFFHLRSPHCPIPDLEVKIDCYIDG